MLNDFQESVPTWHSQIDVTCNHIRDTTQRNDTEWLEVEQGKTFQPLFFFINQRLFGAQNQQTNGQIKINKTQTCVENNELFSHII